MPLDDGHLRRIRELAVEHLQATLNDTVSVCEVPAPTGAERPRAEHVAALMEALGYRPEFDDTDTVFARRGTGNRPAIMLAAHTDTVFPAGTDVTVTRDAGRLAAPAIGDNSLGVAAMLGAIRVLDALDVELPVDIIMAATVGEEGLGNLRGIRAAVDRHEHELASVIAVEGHNLGRVTHAGVGSIRWRVTVTGPGGHSWGAFGKPSAIHGLGSIIHEIGNLQPPTNPKTTYNVGVISGGTTVNTIAAQAEALVDMRSVDEGSLQQMAQQVRAVIEKPRTGLTVSIDVLGERPAGLIDRQHPLIVAAGGVLERLGYQPIFDASSTDANIPISRGIPAVCIGITHGGLSHTVSEFIETDPVAVGVAQLAALVWEAADFAPSTRT